MYIYEKHNSLSVTNQDEGDTGVASVPTKLEVTEPESEEARAAEIFDIEVKGDPITVYRCIDLRRNGIGLPRWISSDSTLAQNLPLVLPDLEDDYCRKGVGTALIDGLFETRLRRIPPDYLQRLKDRANNNVLIGYRLTRSWMEFPTGYQFAVGDIYEFPQRQAEISNKAPYDVAYEHVLIYRDILTTFKSYLRRRMIGNPFVPFSIKTPDNKMKDAMALLNSRIAGKYNAGQAVGVKGMEGQVQYPPAEAIGFMFKEILGEVIDEIGSAFGVPSQLLNRNVQLTYNNFSEGRTILWHDTILPQLEIYKRSLSDQLGITLDFETADIDDLIPLRNVKADYVIKLLGNDFSSLIDENKALDILDLDNAGTSRSSTERALESLRQFNAVANR